MVQAGVSQTSQHSDVSSAPQLCSVSHGQVLQHRFSPWSKVLAMESFQQSSQISAGQLMEISKHACLGAKPQLNLKCEKPGWLFFLSPHSEKNVLGQHTACTHPALVIFHKPRDHSKNPCSPDPGQ